MCVLCASRQPSEKRAPGVTPLLNGCRADVALGVDIVMVGCAWSGCYTGLWTESVGGVDQMGYLGLTRLWASNAEVGCRLSAVGCPLVIVCLLGPYSYRAMLGSGSPCSQEGGSSRQTDRPCYRANRSCCRSPNAVVFRLYSRFPSRRVVTYDWPIVWCSLIFPLVNPRRVWLHNIYKPNPNAVLISSHIIQ